MGRDLPAQPHHTQILHDKGIHITLGCLPNQLRRRGGFLIRHQGVHRQMHRNTPDMTIFYGFRQVLHGKVFGVLPRIELTAAQIDCVGAVLYGGSQCFHGAGRG